MAESFSLKTIRIVIVLGKGSFSEGGNTKVIEGLACEATITKPGLPEKNSAAVKIWGLKYEDMTQLTMLSFRPLELQRNLISIFAGERGEKLSLAFSGEIISAFADFNSAPDVCMIFEADTGTYAQQIAEPALTVDGATGAAGVFSNLARASGFSFSGEGLTTSVKNIRLSGSPVSKAEKLARDIGCELIIDDGTMIAAPAGKARDGNAVFLSRNAGLIGYPTFTQDGISFKCVYTPAITFGGLIRIESIVPRATGVWKVSKLDHLLSAYNPGGGPWETQVDAIYYSDEVKTHA